MKKKINFNNSFNINATQIGRIYNQTKLQLLLVYLNLESNYAGLARIQSQIIG
jgi:hypothetical protein